MEFTHNFHGKKGGLKFVKSGPLTSICERFLTVTVNYL